MSQVPRDNSGNSANSAATASNPAGKSLNTPATTSQQTTTGQHGPRQPKAPANAQPPAGPQGYVPQPSQELGQNQQQPYQKRSNSNRVSQRQRNMGNYGGQRSGMHRSSKSAQWDQQGPMVVPVPAPSFPNQYNPGSVRDQSQFMGVNGMNPRQNYPYYPMQQMPSPQVLYPPTLARGSPQPPSASTLPPYGAPPSQMPGHTQSPNISPAKRELVEHKEKPKSDAANKLALLIAERRKKKDETKESTPSDAQATVGKPSESQKPQVKNEQDCSVQTEVQKIPQTEKEPQSSENAKDNDTSENHHSSDATEAFRNIIKSRLSNTASSRTHSEQEKPHEPAVVQDEVPVSKKPEITEEPVDVQKNAEIPVEKPVEDTAQKSSTEAVNKEPVHAEQKPPFEVTEDKPQSPDSIKEQDPLVEAPVVPGKADTPEKSQPALATESSPDQARTSAPQPDKQEASKEQSEVLKAPETESGAGRVRFESPEPEDLNNDDVPSPSHLSENEEEATEPEDSTRDSDDVIEYKARLDRCVRPTPEQLAQILYPPIVKPNQALSKRHYLYDSVFLEQFSTAVPAFDSKRIAKIINIDPSKAYLSGTGPRGHTGRSRQGSRNDSIGGRDSAGRMSRNASMSNVHSGMGPRSNRQSSRRKMDRDRQGSRRGNDDTPSTPATPLVRGDDAWIPRSILNAENKGDSKETVDDGLLSPEEVQRQVKSLLNKMTLDNFNRVSGQIVEIANQSVKESKALTLRQVLELTYEKAIDEPHWSGVYAKFCTYLANNVSPLVKDEECPPRPDGSQCIGGHLFRRYLLRRLHNAFKDGATDFAKLNESQYEVLSDEYYEAVKAKRRGLGLIRFIGELYKLKFTSPVVIRDCFETLSKSEPTEDVVEAYCKLVTTVGEYQESLAQTSQGDKLVDIPEIMSILKAWRATPGFPARLRFMIMDVEDAQKRNWQAKPSQKGPQTISEIHREAEIEQQKSSRPPPMKALSFARGADSMRSRDRDREFERERSSSSRSVSQRSMAEPSERQDRGPPNRYSTLVHDH